MLTSSFFNLAEKGKKDPTLKIDAACGGIRLTFSDNTGSDLQVVLSTKAVKEIIDRGVKAGLVSKEKT